MPHFGQAIKHIREGLHLTQEELATTAGVSKATVQNIERSAVPRMRGTNYRKLAEALGMSTLELDGQWRSRVVPQQQDENGDAGIPVLTNVPAGISDEDPTSLGLDNGLGAWRMPRQLVGVDDPTAFAVPVQGDSMSPVFQEGDVVVCSPQAKHESGMVAALRLDDGRCTLKRVYDLGDGRLELRPYNDRHPVLIVEREQVVNMSRVVGRYQKTW